MDRVGRPLKVQLSKGSRSLGQDIGSKHVGARHQAQTLQRDRPLDAADRLWLKQRPSGKCFNEADQANETLEWLKCSPNVIRCSIAGRTTLAIGWLNLAPNIKCRSEAGHISPSIGSLKGKTDSSSAVLNPATRFPGSACQNYCQRPTAADESGYFTPSRDQLKLCPKVKSCSE